MNMQQRYHVLLTAKLVDLMREVDSINEEQAKCDKKYGRRSEESFHMLGECAKRLAAVRLEVSDVVNKMKILEQAKDA